MPAGGGGFVLLDPDALAAAAPDCRGRDLLTALTGTPLGDEIARGGAAVPVLGVDEGAYDLVVGGADAAPAGPPAVVSSGWVLRSGTGRLLLTDLAALTRWDPDDLRHRWVSVPPGAYAVQIRGHLPTAAQAGVVDGTYCWVLRPTQRPWFTADLPGPGG